jgi:hypothetical protein
MLQSGKLTHAFQTYWDDMARCRQAKAYWSLLHVTVCLPDICAALQSGDGETSPSLYIHWCDKYLKNPMLSGAERYRMRCKVLHQGRATTDKPGRYTGFAFGEPSETGKVDHMRVEAETLHLDVGELADEMKGAVDAWIQNLEAQRTSADALNVERNLNSLVRVTRFTVPAQVPTTGGVTIQTITINKTN